MLKSTQTAVLTVLAVLAGILLPGRTWATSYVMTTDEELSNQAEVIAEVRILSVAAAAGGGRPAVDYQVQVEGLIRGSVPPGPLVVRVPGGVRPDGVGLQIWGAPRFRESERALLFLRQRSDGTYGILHLMLGAFHQVEMGGRTYWVRGLAGTQEVQALPGDGNRALRQRSHLPRDLEGFRRWLVDRAAGVERAGDYFVEGLGDGLESLSDRFTLLLTPTDPSPFGCGANGGNGIRWTQFDGGGGVPWRAYEVGQSGVPGGGFTQFQTALAAWNNDPRTPIVLTYAGITNASTGFLIPDGINTILFDDPNNEILGSFGGSGTLAIGGPFFDCLDTHTFSGETYHRALEAEIITQDGSSAFFSGSVNTSQAAIEVFGHELGHTLGLGHSCGDPSSPACNTTVLDEALMRAFVHDDGRGAALNSDDRDGIAFLYRAQRTPRPSPPAAPTSLFASAAAIGQFALAWRDNSDNEAEFIIEERSATGDFSEHTRVPANTTFYRTMGTPPATYRSFRVRATNAGGTSDPTNEADGTSFGLAQDCIEDATTLCVMGDRFRIKVTRHSPDGTSGDGTATAITSNAGYFAFFDPSNVELVFKVVRACRTAGAYWIFGGGLTNLQTVVTVEDTRTGFAQTYINPQSTPYEPVVDTTTFVTCP